MKFRKFNGETVPDIAKYVRDYFANTDGGEYEIYVGCDSLPPKKKLTTFVTVVCIRRIGKGCHMLYRKDRSHSISTKGAIFDRLWKEVEMSVGVATYLRDKGILDYSDRLNRVKSLHIDIHLDINPDPAQKSNVAYDSAVGYVTSLGFDWAAKPDAWAATYAADCVARGRFDRVRIEENQN